MSEPSEPVSELRTTLSRQALAAEAADAVLSVFDAYHAQFRLVARRARARFEACDWRGGQQDAVERLTLYRQFVEWVVRDLQKLLGVEATQPALWAEMKRVVARTAVDRADAELAYTFFNSVSRRVLTTVGEVREVSFVDADFARLPPPAGAPIYRTYPAGVSLELVFRHLLRDLPFGRPYESLAADAALVSAVVERHLAQLPAAPRVELVDLIPALLYRNKGAYAVGRLRLADGEFIPLLLPLINDEQGVRVDAVLLTSDEVSVVFSFTRSYFHVEIERPRAMIEFLRSIMPLKPLDELYTSLGYNKHGKTELFRTLGRHLENPEARFEPAEGDRGLVMCVFALPSLNVVFKIIRDRFGPPKNTTRQVVMDKYHLVFVRDRVGRLADAQEFEDLQFPRERFAPAVLDELVAETAGSVRLEGDRIVLRHVYTERRVTPLNVYLRQASAEQAVDAVIDFGHAIKDLAAANIFTGDMLLKNFGVTRHGRVIFYDYDELCLLSECNFRELPEARNEDEELAGEPWFYVGERDVFPAEFRSFLVLPGALGEAFMGVHADLLSVGFWREMQARQAAGDVVDIFPYKQERRLRHAP